uniref:Synaptotagmin-like 1 n=1 Tax=Sinocyclocheilus anshuiensis TaxID=1608454 RepID=A0A671NU29_9TELE
MEQTVILNVLQRDAELRNKEEGRIRSLQQTVSDPVCLRALSGAWFHEERAKRYQKGGTDVVHASIRRKRCEKVIPLTAIFDKEKGNSSQLHEQQEKGKSTEIELQENISVSKDDKGQELKEREKEDGESPIPVVTLERQSRTRHISKVNLHFRLYYIVGESGDKERRILPSTLPTLQIDSEWEMDSGSTELDYTRFGITNKICNLFSMCFISVCDLIRMHLKFCLISLRSGCPPTGELYIWLREIVGLLPTKRGAPSTYVKRCVLFNHTMVYDMFQSSDLIQACAEITVWSPQPPGCLGEGQSVCWMDSTEDEISVWSSVIQSPNSWVDTSLPVRTNLQLCSE